MPDDEIAAGADLGPITSEAPGEAAPAAPEKPSKAPSVRDTMRAAMTEIEAKAETKPDKEVVKSPDDKPRGPDGKFAAKEASADPLKQSVTEQPIAPAKIDPPQNWKGAAKVDWNRLPIEVKQAIAEDYKLRSESDGKFSPVQQALAPHEQALSVAYGSPEQGIKQILATVDYSNRDPVGFLRWFMQTRRIDPNSLAPRQQEGQPQPLQGTVDPIVGQLQQRVDGLTQAFQQERQSQASAIQQSAQSDLNAMFSDAEKFPYAQDVKVQMGILLQSGQAKGLEEAYQTAVYMNPAIRERMVADQKASALKELEQRAADKKASAVSITGAPGGRQPLSAPKRNESARETLLRTAQGLGVLGNAARL